MTTDLIEAQCLAGARFAGDGQSAADFGDAPAEAASAREDLALFDVSDRNQIELTGADRAKFLHNFCTNNVLALKAGQGCEAFITNVKGRVLGHVFILSGDKSLWLETVADAEDTLLSHLDRYIITENVQLHGRSADYGELFVSGPNSAARLDHLGLSADSLRSCEHRTANYAGVALSLRRVDLLGQPGFLLSCPRPNLGDLWSRLVDAGIRPAGSSAFDALRIEAGTPLYGIDITDENLAQEVGRTKQAISFTKGCYLGQEPIARIDALGHVNRQLRSLRLEPGALPERGAVVVSMTDEKELGSVTSSARLSDERPAVALAYLRSAATAAGTKVAVRTGDQLIPAIVLPSQT